MKSKIIGIGSAEMHCNIVKSVKTGQRDNNFTINFKKQLLIYGTSMHQKARCQQAKLSSSGKFWSDDNF